MKLTKSYRIIKSKQCSLFLLITLFTFSSCKDNRKKNETSKIANEWEDKEILFPENLPCFGLGNDTLSEFCDEILTKEFKVLLYVDSAGCSSCRLKLLEWKQLIDEAEILYPGKVGFLFYVQPKRMADLTDMLLINGFDYPVFIDINGSIDSLNQFPQPIQVRLSQST